MMKWLNIKRFVVDMLLSAADSKGREEAGTSRSSALLCQNSLETGITNEFITPASLFITFIPHFFTLSVQTSDYCLQQNVSTTQIEKNNASIPIWFCHIQSFLSHREPARESMLCFQFPFRSVMLGWLWGYRGGDDVGRGDWFALSGFPSVLLCPAQSIITPPQVTST